MRKNWKLKAHFGRQLKGGSDHMTRRFRSASQRQSPWNKLISKECRVSPFAHKRTLPVRGIDRPLMIYVWHSTFNTTVTWCLHRCVIDVKLHAQWQLFKWMFDPLTFSSVSSLFFKIKKFRTVLRDACSYNVSLILIGSANIHPKTWVNLCKFANK